MAIAQNILEWNLLEEESQLEELVEESMQRPVIIYKHSPRCGISAAARKRLERTWDIPSGAITFNFLDVLANRTISNRVSEQFDIKHESPQLLILRDGKVTYHTSHSRISTEAIKQGLEI